MRRSTHAVGLAAMVATALLIGLMIAALAGAFSQAKNCTHGESSVLAWVDAHGEVHQSKPQTTGCIPK